MEKYRKMPKEREPINSDEIRVTSVGNVTAYVGYATRLFNGDDRELPLRCITIKATGNAIARAVAMTEVLKRRIKGLHQITKCGSTTMTDVYEPTEEGLDKVTEDRAVSFLEITLSKDPLDTTNPGYQPPLDESLVREKRPEDGTGARTGGYRGGYMRGGGGMYRGGRGYRGGYRGGGYRGGFRGRGRGRGGGPAAMHAQQAGNANAYTAPGEGGGGYVEEQYAAGQECSNGDFHYGENATDGLPHPAAGGMPQGGGGGGGGSGYPARGGRGRGRGYRGNSRGGNFRGTPVRVEQ